MKPFRVKALVTILSLFILSSGSAQVPDSVYYKRLFYSCKAWGHIKYYHSEVADGNVIWDNELLDRISGIKNAPDHSSFNDSLYHWLKSPGTMAKGVGTLPHVIDSLNNNLDLSWMQHTYLYPSVREWMDTVRNEFRPRDHVLVNHTGGSQFIQFDTDTLYYESLNTAYPHEEMRLLTLFRYWNIIHYFFPYKHQMDQHWDSTLVEFIPQFVEAKNAEEYHLAIRKLITRIDDSHGFYSHPTFSTWSGTRFPPIFVRYIEKKCVVTQTLPQAGQVKIGDVVTHIDGKKVEDIRDSLRDYVNGSNDDIIERELNTLMLYTNSSNLTVTVENGQGSNQVNLATSWSNRLNLHNQVNGPVWTDTILPSGCHYGIVDMGQLEKTQLSDMYSDLEYTDAIVFDIRNYPNGTLWGLVDFLFGYPIPIATFTQNDMKYPGRMMWRPVTIGQGSGYPYQGKLILLFDERTQSQAEYTCMGLEQHPGAIKIGSTTSGADGNTARIYLPGSGLTAATFLGTYYPDYTPTQRVGIIPDYEVRPTIQGIRNGRDEVMEFALNCQWTQGTSTRDLSWISDEKMGYPNPTRNHFYLNNDKTLSRVQVWNSSGKLMDEFHDMKEYSMVDLGSYLPGLYLVVSEDGTQRVIKE
ncbi:T9SS type A sorting domain-containing protein [bacterium SCSIO 12741]|nr:T9SS type A sorting domain-containing protein [bacterium SCSIO 12741]